jgi:hypothetical protein
LYFCLEDRPRLQNSHGNNTQFEYDYSTQLIDLARQLSQKERIQLASILMENDDFISKDDLLLKIKQGLGDIKLHKEGKIKLRTLDEFLADA